jgi:hypothetical protein
MPDDTNLSNAQESQAAAAPTPPLSIPEISDAPSPPTDLPPIISRPQKKFGGKKIIATILGFLVLIGSLGAGVILVNQQQDIREKAQVGERDFYEFKCRSIKVYDADWNLLSSTQLTALKPGETVHLTVSGEPASLITKARFIINGVRTAETTQKKPGTNDVYWYKYTIPTHQSSFTVNAELYSTSVHWF